MPRVLPHVLPRVVPDTRRRRELPQYVMFWDRLMGTYKPYESGLKPGDEGADAAGKLGAEPDRLPAWADAAVEARCGRVAERAAAQGRSNDE